jgi:hypothetical protein
MLRKLFIGWAYSMDGVTKILRIVIKKAHDSDKLK